MVNKNTAMTEAQKVAADLREARKLALAVPEDKRNEKQHAIVAAIPERKSPEQVLVMRLARTINYLRRYAARLDEDASEGILHYVDDLTARTRNLRAILQEAPQHDPEKDGDESESPDSPDGPPASE